MKLTILGTGNALVTECYNTCFVLQDQEKLFLVDAGGGNGILSQLKKADLDWKQIKDIFITHKHIDHILGAIWMLRLICQHINKGDYEGDVNLYAHSEVISILDQTARMVLQAKEVQQIGNRVHLITVEDGESRSVIGHKVTFFDIHSTKAKQFGFTMEYESGKKLTCCGDEPYNETEESYLIGSDWLLHEAFCLFSQADQFHPYEKHHSTVKDACDLAEKYQIPNLLLYHTEDKNIMRRKELYLAEGQQSYHGHLYVPDDLEVLKL